MDENNKENAALLPSRKAKATSVVLGTLISEESKLFTSRKGRTSRKNHNSLPADLAYSFDKTDFTSELSFCVSEEDDNASCMSPMSRISAFRKELDLLKAGCVSTQCNTPSPDFMLMENLNTLSRPPPLPVDEPFRILSSDSSHVVLPMEEFSRIHIPPVLGHVDVIKKIETQFSITDLDMFSGDTFTDSEKLQTLDTTTCMPSVDHLHVDASGNLKGMIRQDSLEYDHLEPGLEDASIIRPTSNNYSVTVQFHELKDTIDCNKPDHATRKISYSTSLHGECVMDDVKIIKQNIDTTKNQSLTYIPSSFSRCPLEGFGNTFSSSIPERLNVLHIKTATTAPSHSLYGINNPIPDEYKCHCPVCCACGSSQRLLVDVGNGRKLSSVSQKCHDETVSNASCPSYPQEKYSNKVKERLTPSIAAVSQGVSKRIDRVSSVKENRFGSSVEISHSSSVIDDELEISGNQTWCEPDSQSIFSIQSLMSCQSGLTYNSSNSYCSFNQPFNRGVEGSLFKDRIEVLLNNYIKRGAYVHVHVSNPMAIDY